MSCVLSVWPIINTILIIVVPFIGKLWVDKRITKFQSELTKAQFIHKLQFEKEFDIYKELWEKLYSLEMSIASLMLPAVLDLKRVKDGIELKDPKSIKWNRMEKVKVDLKETGKVINHNKPFYSDEIYKYAQEIYTLSQDQALKHEFTDDGDSKFYLKAWDNVAKIFSLIQEVEKAIRKRIHNIGEMNIIT